MHLTSEIDIPTFTTILMTTYSKIDFKKSKKLFHQYVENLKSKGTPFDKHCVKEIYRRFEQLEYLLALISGITERERRSKKCLIPSYKLWMFVECFYYISFRTRTLLRSVPGLASFDCPGIRDVRNHLIEHPEGKSSGVLENSFSWGRSYGPVIKSRRRDTMVFMDKGLYVNYLEFQDLLCEKLLKA